jgi:hypothetical protein
MIRIKAVEPEGLQQRFQLQKDLIRATPKDIRQDGSGGVINRMPQPPLVFLSPDKAPHFIHLGFPGALNGYSHFIRMQDAQQGCVDRLQRCFFLFEFTQDSVRTDP